MASEMDDEPSMTMDGFAEHLARVAQGKDVKLHDKVKAFEALTAWEAVKRKVGPVANQGGSGNNGRRNFNAYRADLRESEAN